MTEEERSGWIALLRDSFLPDIEGKKRIRAQFGLDSDGEVAYKVRAKLTGKRYCIIPGVYCDVVQWGDGKKNPSVVMCELEPLAKGVRKMLKVLEDTG